MTGIKPFELSLWGDRLDSNNQFEEYRVCTVASDQMDASTGAFDVKLVTKINGDNQLTFSMYYQFIDNITGEVVKNEIAELLHNEAKLKLHYDGKWYDFVIKDVKKDSSKYTYNFTAKDANIQELSKNGYNLSLTEVQSNNVGTVTELGGTVLADTDWVISGGSDKLYETAEELVLKATVSGIITVKKQSDNENQQIDNNTTVYVFYSNLENKNTRVQFLYRDTWQEPNTEDGVIKDDTWIECYYDISSDQYTNYLSELGINYPSFLDIDDVELGLKAKKHVYNVFNQYSPTLERYVYKYTKNGTEYARDFSTKRDIPILYQDVCTGGRNIKSLDGWSVTTAEKDSLSNGYEYDTTKGTQSYLRWTRKSDNILCNSGIFDNRKYIGTIAADQEWLVEVVYKYGSNASDFKPQFITKTSTPITLNATEISSTSDGGWITTLWKIITSNGTWPIISEREFNLDEKVQLQFIQSAIQTESSNDNNYVDIKKCSLFRSMGQDEDGNYYTPDNISELINTEDKITYYYYSWEDVIGDNRVTDKSKLELQAQVDSTSDLVETYIPVYTCEKTRAVTIEKSNYFNAIQSICESFKCWADFDIQRDENGKITNKQIIFKEYINHPNYAGFKYGLNLSSITRTIKSDQIVTKLLVQPNNNEFAPNKICTIQQAGANPTGDTFIYNMDYYGSQKMLDLLAFDNDLYSSEWDGAKYLNVETFLNSDSAEIEEGDQIKGYYPAIKHYNQQLMAISTALSTASSALSEAESRYEIAEKGKKAAEEALVQELPKAILKIPKTETNDDVTRKIWLLQDGPGGQLSWYQPKVSAKNFTVDNSTSSTSAKYGTSIWRKASSTYAGMDITTNTDGETEVKFILNNSSAPTSGWSSQIAQNEMYVGTEHYSLILGCDIRGNGIPYISLYHNKTNGTSGSWGYNSYSSTNYNQLYSDPQCAVPFNYSTDLSTSTYKRVYWKVEVPSSDLIASNGMLNYYFGIYHVNGTSANDGTWLQYKNLMVGQRFWRHGGSPVSTKEYNNSANGLSINESVQKGIPSDLANVGYVSGIAQDALTLENGKIYIIGSFIRCDNPDEEYKSWFSLYETDTTQNLINDGNYHFYSYKLPSAYNSNGNRLCLGVYAKNWNTRNTNAKLPISLEYPIVLEEADWNKYISPLLLERDSYIRGLPIAEMDVQKLITRIDRLKIAYNQILTKKAILAKAFYQKYKRFIQEGTWSNDKQTDPNLYYNDALATLNNSSYPQVSYDIKVVDISGINDYSDFTYKVGDKTTIEDPEFFGWELDSNLQPTNIPKRETIIVSEATYNLQSPSKNTLKVQTYKTQFNDLFSQITVSVQSVTYSQGGYERAAEFMRAVDEEKSQFITNALNNAASILQHGSQVTTDNTGIHLQDSVESNKMLHLAGGGILLSNDGGKTWRTGITADGIVADEITSGTINTGVLRIMNGNDSTFMWNSYGLTAYYFETTNEDRIINVDYTKGVRFNRFGIYGTNNLVNESNETTESLNDIVNNSVFALTWDGLKVSGNNGAIIKIGKQYTNNDTLSSIFEVKKGDDVRFRIDADGNVYIGGSATIGSSSTQLNSIIDNNSIFSTWIAPNSTLINGATIATGTVMAGIVRVYENNSQNIIFEADGSNHSVQMSGWTVSRGWLLYSGTNGWGNDGSMLLANGSRATDLKAFGGSGARTDWTITSGSKFGVTTSGDVFASSVSLQGSIRSGMTEISDTTNNGYYLGADGISLGKGVFKVTDAGYLTTTSGKIGNFFLSTYLTSNSSKTTYNDTSYDGVFIGSTGIGLGQGKFTVSNTGSLTAKDGTVGGWTIDSNSIYSSGKLKLSTQAVTSLFGGNNYGLQSNFSNGKLFIGFNDGNGGYIALISSNKSNKLTYLMGDDIFIGERTALGGLLTGLRIYPSDYATGSSSNKTVRYAGVWINNGNNDKIYGAVFN